MRTVLRFRPLIDSQSARTNKKGKSLELDTESNTAIINKPNGQQIEFSADHIFDPSSTQQCIFKEVGKRLIDNIIEGYNATVFAYGQTGSGKTYTIFGDDSSTNSGLAFNALKYVFDHLNNDTNLVSSICTVSAVEIYNDKIYDRLIPNNGNQQTLKLRNNTIVHLSSVTVQSFENTQAILNYAISTRMTAATNLNATSSRSHLVITLDLIQQIKNGATLTSKLHFVDLAGSERIKKSGAIYDRLTEAKSINSSLASLGRVVDALITKQKNSKSPKNQHVPFRDSTLTRLLETSLGGNSMTTIIGCCSIDVLHLDETQGTMSFIVRSAAIKNKPVRNRRYSTAQIAKMQKNFQVYRGEAERIIALQKREYEDIIGKLTRENEKLRSELHGTQHSAQHDNEYALRLSEIESLKQKIRSHEKRLSKYEDNIFDIDKLGQKFKAMMFFEAVKNGEIERMVKMLNYVDIDSVDAHGECALSFAVKANNNRVFEYLLEREAAVNVCDKDSISVLMVAVVYQRVKMVQLLVASGVDVDYQNNLGCTAIMIAASRGYGQIVECLLSKTLKINGCSKRGWTTLMFASKAGKVDIVSKLLRNSNSENLRINAVNKAKCSALVLAAYSGHKDVVSILLKYGADWSIRDKFGMSAHIWATKKNYKGIVGVLEAHGSKLTMKDKLHCML